MQKQADIAQEAILEVQRQRELTTQRARAQLQSLANEIAAARQMDAQRVSEMQGFTVGYQKSDSYKNMSQIL